MINKWILKVKYAFFGCSSMQSIFMIFVRQRTLAYTNAIIQCTHTHTFGMSVTRKMTNQRDARTNNRKIMSWLRRRRRLNSFEFCSYFLFLSQICHECVFVYIHTHTSTDLYFLCCLVFSFY